MSPPFVGQSVPRVDGASKARGAAIYVDDIVVPGALYGATVRSSVARGKLRAITKDPSFDWTGVVVLTHADVPHNEVALIEHDQPILAHDEIRHCYEPVALVACEDPVRLQRAVAAIHVEVEPLPAVLTIDDSLDCTQVIYGKDNVQKRYTIEHELAQPIDQIIRGCDVVLSGRYRVHHQEQLYIEPQGMVAWWDSAGVHVTGSLQCPYYVQKAIKFAFALEDAQVHITQAVTGGGFGGKEEYPSVIGAHAALLAKAAKRPVRMIYGRKEDIEATTKRHPARVDVRTGCTKDGELVAIEVKCVMDGGAYVTLTPVVLSRGILHAAGAYRWKHARIEGIAVATNTPPNGAFRGFGAPQTIWAIERHMDRLAAKLGKEPLAFKRARAMAVGSTTVTGQVLRESVGVDECVSRALEASGYERKRAEYAANNAKKDDGARTRRGIGASVFLHGAGFTGSGERKLKGKVRIDLETGGRLRIRTASTDIGQGTETVFRQLAADAARVPIDRIAFETPSTTNVPDSGPTVASRTVMVVGSIVVRGAKLIGERVRAFASEKGLPSTMPEDFARAADMLLIATGARISELVEYEPATQNQWDDDAYRGDAYPCYAWGCDIAEVEVDLDTYEVKVLRFWAAQDIGKAIHPVMCAGQVEGGTLQAIGWALYEDVVWKDGKILNARMTNYVIPTSKDAPPFNTILVEHPFSGGPSGAKGVGELPMDGGAPAIAAAVEQAIGVGCDDLPLLPEKLFEAVRRAARATATAEGGAT
ncbi:MAG: xanthine dehydrogenase family protein molybdopterin-binding subunit [Polyangiaceae bacterium]